VSTEVHALADALAVARIPAVACVPAVVGVSAIGSVVDTGENFLPLYSKLEKN